MPIGKQARPRLVKENRLMESRQIVAGPSLEGYNEGLGLLEFPQKQRESFDLVFASCYAAERGFPGGIPLGLR